MIRIVNASQKEIGFIDDERGIVELPINRKKSSKKRPKSKLDTKSDTQSEESANLKELLDDVS